MISNVEMPERIKKLRLNGEGYPVPWFVAWVDGKPEFRLIGPGKFEEALRFERCWICGGPMGAYKAFVIGPMCAINRVSSEPPSHVECATYAAQVCPFLANPSRQRREGNLPKESRDPAGIALARNPGVALVWVTKSFKVFDAGNGPLIDVGEPTETLWYAHGRKATYHEVTASIATGLPHLVELANQDGPEAVKELRRRIDSAMKLLPGK